MKKSEEANNDNFVDAAAYYPDIRDSDIREIFSGPKLEPVLMYIK